ncbi:hypothetical protein G5C51_31635 [Streptomyces sp. A7024]|uniref:Uncharacterized protein n=1 Tax=Streptomyces coryli TaxID=1128680 RepID=A0A6G4U9S2_9ACTN|nr:hypothetical protein [Streptomyces coryli]NGN68436.1 hypothetical protein [Streptomyces coryli]
MPAALFGIGAGLVCMLVALQVLVDAQLWHDHRTWSYLIAVASTAVVGTAATFGLRRLWDRRGMFGWHVAVFVLLQLGVLYGGTQASTYLFPSAFDRYERELGGSGRCLHGTPYAPDAAVIEGPERNSSRMTITPLEKKAPALRLDHARDGGVHALTAADGKSRAILERYGC